MQYINLTPRWTEILSVWQRIVERCNSAKRYHREDYNKNMNSFWNEMQRMAEGADKFNALVTEMRAMAISDEKIEAAIERGFQIMETERNTVRETEDAMQ